MQGIHVFRVIDQIARFIDQLVIRRIVNGRNDLLTSCPQTQILRRIIARAVAITADLKVAVINLIIEDAGFNNGQFAINAHVLPHLLQNLRNIGMQLGLRIFVGSLQRIAFIITSFG